MLGMGPCELDPAGIVVACPRCGQRNRRAYARLGEPMRCGKCRHDLPHVDVPVEVTGEALFARLVDTSSLPVVVDFWAPWCGPCRMVAPELQKMAAANAGRLVVAKVNTDELPEIGARFGVQSIPTMTVFHRGREAGRAVGARPARDIEALVAGAVAP